MRCPKCEHVDDKVIDSRSVRNGDVIRRRRMCLGCGYRFTTYEQLMRAKLRVIKTDGRHEDLNRQKLVNGIQRACEKRPISAEQIETVVDGIIDESKNIPRQKVDAGDDRHRSIHQLVLVVALDVLLDCAFEAWELAEEA